MEFLRGIHHGVLRIVGFVRKCHLGSFALEISVEAFRHTRQRWTRKMCCYFFLYTHNQRKAFSYNSETGGITVYQTGPAT